MQEQSEPKKSLGWLKVATVSGLLTGLGASAAYAYNRSAKVEIGDVGLELGQSE